MAKKKSIEELSAEELYELAEARAAEEREHEKEKMRAQLEELRAERKAIMARHRKELAEIDARIRKFGGRTGGRSSGGSVSAGVLDILADGKQHSTKEIQAELQKRGITANNLAQTLAYLKRQNKVASPQRSIYTTA